MERDNKTIGGAREDPCAHCFWRNGRVEHCHDCYATALAEWCGVPKGYRLYPREETKTKKDEEG